MSMANGSGEDGVSPPPPDLRLAPTPEGVTTLRGFPDEEPAELECDHEWEWVRDWFGDPSIPNGTCDCSGWICKLCGSTDCEDEPPGPPEPPDPRDD